MRVSLIGLGNMGLPIAENILKNGHELVVYNRTESKVKDLASKGAEVARTAAEAARETGIVFTVLSDDKAAEDVVYGDTGIINGLKNGGIHVSISTLSVDLSEKLARDHLSHHQHFVSSTVLGRPDAAASAALRLIVAGPEEARNKIMPILKILGQDIFVVGDEGYLSNVVKLGNNFLIVSMLEALSEILAMVEKYGIEPKQFLNVVNTLFGSPVYKNYGNIIAENNFEPAGFKMKLGLKDVDLMIAAANKVSVQLPSAELAKNNFSEAVSRGWGELDWAALIKLMKH
ncbi:NAD(P)-dependent oxidoreductase [Aneurinibacillus tyrosinisolvens]|uniref:NAD(P)-dependent oxidoreductase n=1 Tax=Aneurinibacillus tyrosinisolvens TaxID=1443435 RepID=UPI00063F403A|nr:NAD(P)-dependent oxidoreductase [Aneurinibacillus tyrosinisolvens]